MDVNESGIIIIENVCYKIGNNEYVKNAGYYHMYWCMYMNVNKLYTAHLRALNVVIICFDFVPRYIAMSRYKTLFCIWLSTEFFF